MKLQERHTQDFETYLNNIGLKEVTSSKHLLYFKHFKEMFDGFLTQKTIDSFLEVKISKNHKAMIKHLTELMKRDNLLSAEEQLEVSRLSILKKVGRAIKLQIKIMSKREIEKLIESCQLSTPFQTQRFKVMCAFQYSSGLRVSELCSLRWEHLNYQGRTKFYEDGRDKLPSQKLRITPDIAKGNKEAYFYVKTDVYLSYFDFLKEWSESEPSAVAKIQRNECSIWRKNKKKYSSEFKEQVFRTLGFRLPDNKSSHILRHSRATHLLEEGMTLLGVRDYMRHSSVAVTEQYLHLAKDSVSKELDLLSKKSESSP